MGWEWYPRYVSVAERKRKAERQIDKMKKKGRFLQPVVLSGRTIASSFWGKAWCGHLETYSDYENRLPRGRTYVRNGSVIDLQVTSGKIAALVNGSSMYKVDITVEKIASRDWKKILSKCTGQIDSLIELLQGKLSRAVMEIISDPKSGLFPEQKEIKLSCSCPDWAEMCKHVAAVLYGVGARLDARPEELFLLRQIDHMELVTMADSKSLIAGGTESALDGEDLSSLFGIEMDGKEKGGESRKPGSRAVSKKKTAVSKTVGSGRQSTRSTKKVSLRTGSEKDVRAKKAKHKIPLKSSKKTELTKKKTTKRISKFSKKKTKLATKTKIPSASKISDKRSGKRKETAVKKKLK